MGTVLLFLLFAQEMMHLETSPWLLQPLLLTIPHKLVLPLMVVLKMMILILLALLHLLSQRTPRITLMLYLLQLPPQTQLSKFTLVLLTEALLTALNLTFHLLDPACGCGLSLLLLFLLLLSLLELLVDSST